MVFPDLNLVYPVLVHLYGFSDYRNHLTNMDIYLAYTQCHLKNTFPAKIKIFPPTYSRSLAGFLIDKGTGDST